MTEGVRPGEIEREGVPTESDQQRQPSLRPWWQRLLFAGLSLGVGAWVGWMLVTERWALRLSGLFEYDLFVLFSFGSWCLLVPAVLAREPLLSVAALLCVGLMLTDTFGPGLGCIALAAGIVGAVAALRAGGVRELVEGACGEADSSP